MAGPPITADFPGGGRTGTFPNYSFGFTGIAVAAGEAVLLEAVSGDVPTDSQGNSYALVASNGVCKAYWSILTTALATSDTVSIANCIDAKAYKVTQFDAIQPIGATDTDSGSFTCGSGVVKVVHVSIDNSVNAYDPHNIITRGIGGIVLANTGQILDWPPNPGCSPGTNSMWSINDGREVTVSLVEVAATYFGLSAFGFGGTLTDYNGGTQHWDDDITIYSSLNHPGLTESYDFLLYQIYGLGTVPPATGADGCDGIDLVRSAAGWLFATWQDAGEVFVARSTDQGATFDRVISVSADGDLCCAPALCIDAHDELLLAYHTIDPLLRVWHLPGLLDGTPVPAFDFLTITHPYTFPRPLLVRPDLMLLAALNGSNLQVFSSPDYGITTTLLKDYGTQPKDRCAFGLDRHGIAHLIYRDAGDVLKWDWSADLGGHWNGAATLASALAYAPAYAAGAHDGFVAYFVGGTLTVQALNSDYHSVRAAVTAPAGTFQRLPSGAWIDTHEDWWLLLRDSAGGHARKVRYSANEGETWVSLAATGL